MADATRRRYRNGYGPALQSYMPQPPLTRTESMPSASVSTLSLLWDEGAACAGKPTDMFYGSEGPMSMKQVNAARAICATCPISAECLMFSLVNREPYGVWGGVPAPARRTAIKRHATVEEAAKHLMEAAP